jgi:hypothetical protein
LILVGFQQVGHLPFGGLVRFVEPVADLGLSGRKIGTAGDPRTAVGRPV